MTLAALDDADGFGYDELPPWPKWPTMATADIRPRAESPDLRQDLLRVLHPAGYRDLRAFRKGVDPETFGFHADNLGGVDEFADLHRDRNVYVGVAPRADGKSRGTDACVALYALFADIDFKDSSEAEARGRLAAFPLVPSAVVASGGGLQVYWLLQEALDLANGGAAHAKQLLRALATALGADLSAAEPARILRLPGTLNHKYDPPRLVVVEALSEHRRYRLDDLAAALPPILNDQDTSQPLPSSVAEGSRNETLFREGCRLRRLGWSEAEIVASLHVLNTERCHPALDRTEVESIAHSCGRYEPEADTFPTTETGDAEFFAACNTDMVRFDHRRGRWLLYDGNIWAPQTDGEVARLALNTVRARQRAAVGNKEQLKWALGGEARSRQTNLLALAQNIKPLADAGDSWDLDPWLLGATNGVIDLRTGMLRAGRPDDRITRQVRASFDPMATCPLWDATVAAIFEHDQELMAYFDRYVGYSLSGDCREESLALCWGDGANGKGTLLNTLGWLLGDYADDLPFSAFELHSRAGIPNDIAKIAGKRFVTASETGETQRLNEPRVKALTGRDPITARFLHREFFTFQPVAKFWLSTNHRPQVRDDSLGFWRRIHLIPFKASFIGREDKTLKDRLRGELRGILARAVRGSLAWQRDGLNPPNAVRAATEHYRIESMPLARFLDECCVVQPDKHATFGELFQVYVRWAGPERMGRHEFNAALRQRFKQDEKHKERVVFVGIGVLDLWRDGATGL
jgi:P4 family phage/plasmid primase-like protien